MPRPVAHGTMQRSPGEPGTRASWSTTSWRVRPMTIPCTRRERRFHLLRMLAAAAVCLLVIAAAGPPSLSAQAQNDAAVLDGRIGGSVGAFEAKYGAATNDPGVGVD